MGSPDTKPQSEEFATENKFRVELPDAKRLYYVLDHSPQITPERFIPEFKIGTYQSKDELFSQINVQAMVVEDRYLLRGGYSISVSLKYQNQIYQYWPKEEVEQLREILTYDYGHGVIKYQVGKGCGNSLIIRDCNDELLYALNLGPDEKTAWEDQIQADYETLTNTKPHDPLVKMPDEKALRRLIYTRYPIPVDSSIDIKPIHADPHRPSLFDLLQHPIVGTFTDKAQAIEIFTATTEEWAQFIEDAVNAMSKVKRIPQSGKLTLLPPQDVPQT